jgi:predicted RNase H-like HicB family nuclease
VKFGGVGDKFRDKVFRSGASTRYRSRMAAASVDFTISFDSPDEEGWIVARVLEVPGAMSQGRTREEARENALDALRTVLTPDEELAGETPASDREHLRFTAAA